MKSLSLSKPHVIVMVGLPGSGKSFFAEKFAETFHAPYVNRGKITAHIKNDTSVADTILHYQLGELLKTQQSIIVEGMSDTRTERSELAQKARKAGYDMLIVWVQTDPATTRSRAIKGGKDRASLTPEEYDRRTKRFTPPSTIEKPIVISGKHTYATQAKVILKKLSEPRTQISKHSSAPVRTNPPDRHNITIR